MPNRRVSVAIDAEVGGFTRGLLTASTAAKGFAHELESADSRLSNLVQSGLALAPALVPIGAAAVPAIAGLTTQLGFAVAAAGTAALAFSGVGDALDALNKAQLEPTAENIDAAREAFSKLGPAGQEFVVFIDDLIPKLQTLQDTAQEGLLPGIEEGISTLLSRLPQVRDIISEIAETSGDLFAEGATELAGPGWDEFFDYLENNARPILEDFGHTVGNVIEGIANTWMALDPLSQDFSDALLGLSRDFAEWSDTLAQSDGFREFVAYVREAGPQVWETLGSIANAVLQVVEATAPVGEVALPLIEALADALAAVADSPAGPALIGAAAGLSAVSRAVALFKAANASAMVGMLGKVGGKGAAAGVGARAAAAGIGMFALSMTDLDDKIGLSNTAMFAMMGAFAGPWGAALGAGVGATLDLTAANNDLTDALGTAEDALRSQPEAFDANTKAIASAKQALLEFRQESFNLGQVKNAWEGYFGASDIEEAEARISDLIQQQQTLKAAARELATALGEDMSFGDRAAGADELAQALARATPALDAYGTSLEEVAELNTKRFTGGPEAAKAQAQWVQLTDFVRNYIRESDSLPGRTRTVADAFEGLEGQLASTEDKASALATALDALLGPELNQAEAADAWRLALNNLDDDLAEHSRRLRGNSDAALANRGAIRDRVEALAATIKADAAAGVGAAKLADKLRSQRRALLEQAEAAGLSRKQTKALLEQYGLTPKLIQTVFRTLGIDKAEQEAMNLRDRYNALPKDVRTELRALGTDVSAADVDRLQRKYDLTPGQVDTILNAIDQAGGTITFVQARLSDLDGSRADVYLYTHETTIRKVTTQLDRSGFYAAGGIETYAAGDVRNGHQPEIAAGSPVHRIWAEEETGGESYIPHANDWRRPRAIDIWERTGDILGVQFQRFDAGGMSFASGGYSLDQRIEILRLEQQLRQIRRDLAKHGDNELRGLARKIAEAELKQGRRELRRARNEPEREHRQDVRDARQAGREFATGNGQTVREVRDEIRDFRQSIKAAGGDWTKHLQRMSDRLVRVTREYQQHSRALERSRDQLDELRDQRRDFQQSVAGNFRRDVFGDGLDLAMLKLHNDVSGASGMNAALRNAARLGLDGAAFQALASSGDVMAAQQIDTRAEVRQVERLFAQRAQETAQLARFAGGAAYGEAIRHQAQETRHLANAVERLERKADRWGDKIERGAERGVRQGFDPNQAAKHAARRQVDRMGRH